MNVVVVDQGKVELPVDGKVRVLRKRDDYIALKVDRNIVFTFEIVDYVNIDNPESGHMTVSCHVGQSVYMTRGDYERSSQFTSLGNMIEFIMVQATSKLYRPR
jgi:hypothetical protein